MARAKELRDRFLENDIPHVRTSDGWQGWVVGVDSRQTPRGTHEDVFTVHLDTGPPEMSWYVNPYTGQAQLMVRPPETREYRARQLEILTTSLPE